MAKNRTFVNVASSVVLFLSGIITSFWLTPVIIENIGVEANGFIGLGNNIISYITLVTTALNSMASRFITIFYIKKDYKKANEYYNSIFWGNLIIMAVFLLPLIYFVVNLENLISVPANILSEVRLMFIIVFLNFVVNTCMPKWSCATFITNRLDRSYFPNVIISVLRTAVIVILYTALPPRLWYVSLVSMVTYLIGVAVARYNAGVLTPELKLHLKPKKIIWSFSAIKELVSSGIWNSISSVGNMLLSGLDLIICNLFIGATEMGVLSLSKTLPHLMQSLSSSICNAFAPELVINYAQGDKEKVLKDINRAMKLTSVILIVPLAGIIVMGSEFYKLWVPSQDAKLLSFLTIITCAGYAFTSGTQILYNVFATVNKVKANAVLMIVSGAVSTAAVFVLLNTTNLGIFAIAGVSTVVNFIRNMIYTLPFTAKYLGFKKTQFFPQVLTCVTSTLLLSTIGFMLKRFFTISSWLDFFAVAAIIGILFSIVNIFVFLSKEERKVLFDKIKRKIKR
ncbi:MAG: MATE family efflux transporter [Clostridia bacterium]|nr:MATE family efflux transporter [Clostridia bacterium]